MAEQTMQQQDRQQVQTSGQTTAQQGSHTERLAGGVQYSTPLQTPMGATHIDKSVVAKIAGVSAQEIDGVQMGGTPGRTMSGIMESIGMGGGQSRGVSVEVGEIETAVDLTLAVEYGRAIPQVTEAVRRNVIDRVESLVGLKVTEVNINVDNVYFPGEDRNEGE